MRNVFQFLFFVLCVSALLGTESNKIRIVPQGEIGECSVADWKRDWPGCEFEDGVKEGHLTVVERNQEKRFRVDFEPGAIGPEKGGIGWRFPVPERETATLRYVVRFSPNFEWVKGGKLPGLSGGPKNVSGGRPADGTNGFSCRLMWRADGRGEAYVYHKNQKTKYGDRFDFSDDFRFKKDADIFVKMQLAMNSPGKSDGKIRVWIGDKERSEGRLVVSRDDIEWRIENDFRIDSIYFQSFFGGSNKTWAPSRKCWIEFGKIELD